MDLGQGRHKRHGCLFPKQSLLLGSCGWGLTKENLREVFVGFDLLRKQLRKGLFTTDMAIDVEGTGVSHGASCLALNGLDVFGSIWLKWVKWVI